MLSLAAISSFALLSGSTIHAEGPRCFKTGGDAIQVCHNPGDEGVYYATPYNEVAYNTHLVKLADDRYQAVIHAESYLGQIRSGDSMKWGAISGTFNYQMPPLQQVIHGSVVDKPNAMYNGYDDNPAGVSGAGNPMVIGGRPGDPYKYIFFLGVKDGSNANPNIWRHKLLQARTKDFTSVEIASQNEHGQKLWVPFGGAEGTPGRRPNTLLDTSGQEIRSNAGMDADHTQGLIGSIVYVNDVYYLFYFDFDPANPSTFKLYYRTATDISRADTNNWSPAKLVSGETLALPSIIRVAKAKGMDRWVVVYGCYQPETNKGDICVQYTTDMSMESLGAIKFFENGAAQSPYYLGIAVNEGSRGQHYFMTDVNGTLATPAQEPAGPERGGFLTWTNFIGANIYGAKVWRAGWDVTILDGSGAGGAARGRLEKIGTNPTTVDGWACISKSDKPVEIRLYAGHPTQGGALIGGVTAAEPAEPGLGAAECDGGKAYRFKSYLTPDVLASHAGKPIYANALSAATGLGHILPGSGELMLPGGSGGSAVPPTAEGGAPATPGTSGGSAMTPEIAYEIQRYFNKVTGKHFLTGNAAEATSNGFTLEGGAVKFLPAGTAGTVKVYRCFNGTRHSLTTDAACDGSGRAPEGVYGALYPTPQPGMVPIYRGLNWTSMDSLATYDQNELTRNGYVLEGVIGYGPAP